MNTLTRLNPNKFAKLLITKQPPNSRRYFWKVDDFKSKVFIRSIGSHGYIFEHLNVECSITNFMTSGEGSELNYGTKNVLSCWNSSLGKLDEQTRKEYLEKLNKHLESGKPITLRFEKHFLGMPTRGFIGDPFYIMEIIDDI